MMKSAATALAFLLLLAAPLAAQDRNVTVTIWASQADMQGDNDLGDFETEFDEEFSLGASAAFGINRWLAAEVSVFNLRSSASLALDNVALDLGKAELTPVMAGVQLHLLGGSRFDPYVGAGGAYVMADELFSADLEAVNLGAIELEDKLTYYLNAGIGLQITRGFGLAVDARWIPYETTSRSAVTGGEEDLDLSPMVLSAGLRLRF